MKYLQSVICTTFSMAYLVGLKTQELKHHVAVDTHA